MYAIFPRIKSLQVPYDPPPMKHPYIIIVAPGNCADLAKLDSRVFGLEGQLGILGGRRLPCGVQIKLQSPINQSLGLS